MKKWFEETDAIHSNLVYSRVRLTRNWAEYPFPARMSDARSREMLDRMKEKLEGLATEDGRVFTQLDFSHITNLEQRALAERRAFNPSQAEQKKPMSLLYLPREDMSVLLNGSDHIRIQALSTGLALNENLRKAWDLDDKINEKLEYAFDEKYGYLTSYPTNVGTGMRASVIVHLPGLSRGKKFPTLINEMGRFGISVKGLFREGRDNFGSFFEISNQKTMGQTEKDMIELVSKIALQLSEQEKQVHSLTLDNHRAEKEDEIYKSYGVLRYARRLTQKEAMNYLSALMEGQEDRIISFSEPCSLFAMILGIQTANLLRQADRPMDREELDGVRAEYIRKKLPEILQP